MLPPQTAPTCSAQPSLALHHSLSSAGAWALNGSAELVPLLSLFSNIPWSSCLGLGIAVLQHHILKPQLKGMGKGLTVKRGWVHLAYPIPSPWREPGKMVHFPCCSLAFPAGTTEMMCVVWSKQH